MPNIQDLTMSDGNIDSASDGDSYPTLEAGGKGGNKSGPKRRASRAGTRSVATLSEAQLARKRANDREAQRLIRQRTKDHIEQLEQRIQELSGSQWEDGELHELRRRNSELERELRDLKEIRALSEASMASPEPAQRTGKGKSIQGHLSAPTSFPSYMSAAFDASATPSPLSTSDNSWPPPHVSPYSSLTDPTSSRGSFSPGYFQFDPSSGTFSYDHADLIDPSMGPSMGVMGPTSVDPILADVESDRTWMPATAGSSMPNPIVTELQTSISVQPSPIVPTSFTSQPSVPAWEMPTRHTPPTGPIDSILLGLVQQQRNMALGGVTGTLITGPYQPAMNMIVYPDQKVATHPVSSILSDLLTKTALPRLPERAAVMFAIYHFVQWQIQPSKTTFNALFEWQIPRTSQVLTPHPIWATLIAWGKLRDAVIGNQPKYATDEFEHLYASSLNVNWPWRDIDTFRFEEGGEIRISDEFERHISLLSNWSLDAPFARRYPELESCCRFTRAEQNDSGSGSPK